VNELDLAKILIPALASLIGAAAGVVGAHFLTRKRDRDQKRREFALKYIIEAWQNLEVSSRDGVDLVKRSHAMEKAVADIQLFGSPEQIMMADRFAKEITTNSSSNTTIILQELQNDLRKELGLKRAPVRLFFLRITPKNAEDLKRYNER
jgi:hypothetical protein